MHKSRNREHYFKHLIFKDMKKIFLYRKVNGSEKLEGRYDSVEEAQETVKELTEDEDNGSVFDYFYKEEEYEEITDRVKSYEDACKVLGVEPINEQNAKAQGFKTGRNSAP